MMVSVAESKRKKKLKNIARRAGRKRLSGVREANGQLSRRAQRKADYDKSIDARARHYGVSKKRAKDALSGSALGRLKLNGEITQAQYEAGFLYDQLYHDFLIAIDAKTVKAINYDRDQSASSNIDDEQVQERNRKIVQRWRAAHQAVLDSQASYNDYYMVEALNKVVIEDVEHHYYTGSLRLALNALAKHFHIPAKP